MTSHESFERCLRYSGGGRIPVDYIAHHETDRRMKDYFGVQKEEELLDALGADFFYLPRRDLSQRQSILEYYRHTARRQMSETERTCPLGIRWKRGVYDAKFSVDSAISGPLEHTNDPQDVLDFTWPQASDFDFTPLHDIAAVHSDRVRVGGFWSGILGDAYRMHGFQTGRRGRFAVMWAKWLRLWPGAAVIFSRLARFWGRTCQQKTSWRCMTKSNSLIK